MTGRLAGQVALVTGAAQGQGRVHAARLAAEGADIIAVDLAPARGTKDPLADTVAEVTHAGRRVRARHADVRDLAALTSAVGDGVEEFGRLDVVVANAGVLRAGAALDLSEEDWRLSVDVNVTGVWLTCKAAVPSIIAGRKGGSVVITSSIWGLKGSAGLGAYATSKHAVVGLMRTLAIELAPHQIRVNSLHPTAVDTPMIRATTPPGQTFSEYSQTLGHMNALPIGCIEADDVANAVLFLASDDARYITGVALPVDAGALVK